MLAVIRADRSQPYGQVNSYFTYILHADYLALCEIIERTSDTDLIDRQLGSHRGTASDPHDRYHR